MTDIKFHIKEFITRSPNLYSAVQYFRGHPYQIVGDKTMLCLEGYPRSANTYSLNLIRGALIKHFPVFFSTHAERLMVHHTHRVATVKAARRRGIPTLVLLRSPHDAIPSAVVKRKALSGNDESSTRLIRHLMKRYKYFYEYMIGKKDIDIVKFETVIKRPQIFIEHVLEKIGLDMPDKFNAEEVCEFSRVAIKKWSYRHMKHNSLSENFSNEKKEKEKIKEENKMQKKYPKLSTEIKKVYHKLEQSSKI